MGAVGRSWQLEHAQSILETLHREKFGPEEMPIWLSGFVKTHCYSSVVEEGRVIVRTEYCATPHAPGYAEAQGPMLQDTRSRLAIAHVLACSRSGPLPQWFRDRARDIVSDPMSENANNCVMSHIELAAACLLEMEGGVRLAERYYQEVHGLVARFVRTGFHHGEWGEPLNEYAASWEVSFDLGAVDEAAHQQRMEQGKKRVVRDALLEGPRRKRAKGDRNIAIAILERRLGLQARPALARIAAFLEVEDFMWQDAFR